MSTLHHLPHVYCVFCFLFFCFYQYSLSDAISFKEEMTFCLMEAIAGTLLRFPWLIWIEVKTPLCFGSVFFQDDCPYFLGKLFRGNGFIPKCITKFAICTWCALNRVGSCFPFPKSVPVSKFIDSLSFLFVITKKLYAFSKFWILRFFMIHLSVTT